MTAAAAKIPAMARNQKDGAAEPRFGEIVRDLLIEQGITTGLGNPNWMKFSKEHLNGVNYEVLRKAVTGVRHPHPELMEACATALGVDPMIFPEYQLYQWSRQFDAREVGIDAALEALKQHQRQKR